MIFVTFVISKLVVGGEMWTALAALSVSMLAAMAFTMLAPEKPLEKMPSPVDWTFLLRLMGMTAAFTTIILGAGEMVQWVTATAKDAPAWIEIALVGLAGLVGMGIAVGLGVWLSLRISTGVEFYQHTSYTWWVVNRLAFLVAITNLATFLVFFLQERFPDLSAEKAAGPAAKVMMFVGVAILLTALPGGWLGDRFGKKMLIAVSGVLAAIGTLIVALTPGMNMLYLGGFVIGAGSGLFYSVNWALGTELVPRDKAGQFLGMQNLAGAGAGAIGAYIGGPIADNTSYVLLLSIYALLFLLSLLPLLGIVEKRSMV